MQKVFLLGPAGSYGHEAVQIAVAKLLLGDVEFHFQPSNISILEAAEEKTGLGIVPVENSTYGDVSDVLEYLAKQSTDYPLRIIGQIELSIRHCLLVSPDINSTSELKGLISHPQAFGQCKESMNQWGIVQTESINSTSAAAKFVAENPSKKFGALASKFAAGIYGLKILYADVQTFADNTTRFFVFGRNQNNEPTGNDKSVFIFRVKNKPGALLEALVLFAARQINITALHSVSLGGWRYGFYVEIEGHQKDELIKSAFDELKVCTEELLAIGSFPK